jgi:hypothetical protein
LTIKGVCKVTGLLREIALLARAVHELSRAVREYTAEKIYRKLDEPEIDNPYFGRQEWHYVPPYWRNVPPWGIIPVYPTDTGDTATPTIHWYTIGGELGE